MLLVYTSSDGDNEARNGFLGHVKEYSISRERGLRSRLDIIEIIDTKFFLSNGNLISLNKSCDEQT